MSLILDKGTQIRGIRPETVVGMVIVQGVFAEMGRACVITSCVDGEHSLSSLHYAGCAFDVRFNFLTEAERQEAYRDMTERLGGDFDVVWEPTHFHIEYQPKGRML